METIAAQLPENQRPLNFKEWALYIFLGNLPLVGWILLLVWAFGEGNIHRKEWAKGLLLIYLIVIILWILFLFVFGGIAVLGALLNN